MFLDDTLTDACSGMPMVSFVCHEKIFWNRKWLQQRVNRGLILILFFPVSDGGQWMRAILQDWLYSAHSEWPMHMCSAIMSSCWGCLPSLSPMIYKKCAQFECVWMTLSHLGASSWLKETSRSANIPMCFGNPKSEAKYRHLKEYK